MAAGALPGCSKGGVAEMPASLLFWKGRAFARLWSILTSRAGLIVLTIAAVLFWHFQDKAAAVEAAKDGLVRASELAAAQAELVELRRIMAVEREAAQALQEKVQVARGEALRFAAELEAYERETEVNPEGRVDADLLHRLRAN